MMPISPLSKIILDFIQRNQPKNLPLVALDALEYLALKLALISE
tara:strand:- start:439 stop:570 length:132 start_codon:yes stop_codon:yes gene_type:complete